MARSTTVAQRDRGRAILGHATIKRWPPPPTTRTSVVAASRSRWRPETPSWPRTRGDGRSPDRTPGTRRWRPRPAERYDCLYRTGYDFKRLFISEYYERDRLAFYGALQQVREEGMDLTGWLNYFVAGLSTQLQEVKLRGEHAIRADLVAREHKLNARQAVLVDAFMRDKRLTLAACERLLPATNRRTLQRDLRGLAEAGLIQEVGQATDPTRHYLWQQL
jgi:hypothetical protein